VYSFRRGAYYPFVPEPAAGGTNPEEVRERDESLEYKLAGVLDGELSVEDDRGYWYPLWPDSPGDHPWE
jgi:hypothetical protein